MLNPLVTPDVHSEVLRYLELTREQLRLLAGEIRVLDFGCGEGDAVRSLRQLGYLAFGCDVWAEGLDRARTPLLRRDSTATTCSA